MRSWHYLMAQQHTCMQPEHHLSSIAMLVSKDGDSHDRDGMIRSLIEAVGPGMGDKRLDGRMTQNVILRCPGDGLHMLGQLQRIQGQIDCNMN